MLGIAERQFIERCITAICDLIETPPEHRKTPDIVVAIDAIKANRGEGPKWDVDRVVQALIDLEEAGLLDQILQERLKIDRV